MRSALLAMLFALGCDGHPHADPTLAICPAPDPLVLGYTINEPPNCAGTAGECSFGKDFMDRYCTMCHSSSLDGAARNGAPKFHDFDTLLGIIQVNDHIDEQAGSGPGANNTAMPPERCPTTAGGPLDRACAQPTLAEREQLATWLACERDRQHSF